MPTTVVIEEDIPSDAQRVELRDSDLPYAKPRETAGFHSGGPVEHERVYLPGRKKPIYQVQQARERDLVIKGAFRDHLFVADGGTEQTNHARAMRDAIEEIRGRRNPVRVRWGDQERSGLLVDADFGEESESQITYEITIAVSEVTGARDTESGDRQERPVADIAAQMRKQVVAQKEATAAAVAAIEAREAAAVAMLALEAAAAALAALEAE